MGKITQEHVHDAQTIKLDEATVALINGLLHSEADVAHGDGMSSLLPYQYTALNEYLCKQGDRSAAWVLDVMLSNTIGAFGEAYYLPFEFDPKRCATYIYPSSMRIFALANTLLHDGDGQLNETQYNALLAFARTFLSEQYVMEITNVMNANDGYYFAEYEIGF